MPKKIKFPRQKRVLDCEELGYPKVKVTLWDNPSRRVRLALLNILGAKPEELEEKGEEELDRIESEFLWALSELIIDCNVEGYDFSTPEAARDSYDVAEPDFLPRVVIKHISDIIERGEEARKK